MTPFLQDTQENISIKPVKSWWDMHRFIQLPRHIYADDPYWVPPLYIERRFHFSGLNPFFKHGKWQAWLACLDGRPAGRICAQVDYLHRQRYGDSTGHFGLIETVNSPGVSTALFKTAEDWLIKNDAKIITGPFNLSINQECGLLVDGFDTPPVLMMPHGRKWYRELIEMQGYTGVKDLLAYWVNVDFKSPRAMLSLLARYGSRVTIRTLQRKHMNREMEILRDIFNEAWSENWGFVPFTQEEFAELGTSLKLFVPDNHVQIAEIDNEPVAFIATMPNLNEVFAEIDGRLFPTGWLTLVHKLKRQQIRTGRVPLMGVRKKYQNTPMGIALAYLVIEHVRQAISARGVAEVEMSWILEDNKGMVSILDSIGSTMYKRYRIYEKLL